MKLLRLIELNIYSLILALLINFVVVALFTTISLSVAYLVSYVISFNMLLVLKDYKI